MKKREKKRREREKKYSKLISCVYISLDILVGTTHLVSWVSATLKYVYVRSAKPRHRESSKWRGIVCQLRKRVLVCLGYHVQPTSFTQKIQKKKKEEKRFRIIIARNNKEESVSLFPERERERERDYISRVDMEEEKETPRSFADAVVLFALPVSENDIDDFDAKNEDEHRKAFNKVSYAEIRSYSKRLKELGCGKVIDSFSLKTRDVTHVVCESERQYDALWHDSQNDANDFFLDNPEEEGDFDGGEEKRKAPVSPVKCTFEFVRRSVEEKTLLDVRSNILFQPPKTSEKILKGLKICQTSYTGARRNDVKLLIERLGAAYSKPFDKTCTHLCCYQFEGKKYEKAASDGTTIVSHAWLEACYVSGEKVDASRYMRSGEEEDLLAQEKDVVPDSEAEEEEEKEKEEEEEEEEEIEDVIEDVVCVKDLEKNISTETQKEPNAEKENAVQKQKDDEETEIPATEAQAKLPAPAYHKEEEEEKEKEKEKAPSSTGSKKYPSPDYNNLPPDQVERCVRNIIDPTHSKSSNEFQGLLANADDVEAALNNGGTFAMANSFPCFGDNDGPLCKETDEDAFFELLMAGKIPPLADGENNDVKVDRVSKGKRVFEVLRDVEDIDDDFFRHELGVEALNVSKGPHKVHQTRQEAKRDAFKAVCFSLKTTNLDGHKFDEIRANALTCLNEADKYAERGPLGRAVSSRLALERAQNGTLLDSNNIDDPDALLATFVNVYLRFGYNFTPRAAREMFMTDNGTKIIQDLNFIVTLPERKPGNLPNVILESVNRTVGQVVAGFFELLAGPTQPDPTQRALTQPSAEKKTVSQQLSPSDGVYLTQIATQPPPATQTWEQTNEVEEDIDEGVQEGEEDKDDVAVTTIVDVAEDEDEDEAPPVLEPVPERIPERRVTRKRKDESIRISAPTAEQQRKSFQFSLKKDVDKYSAKQKEKTAKKTHTSKNNPTSTKRSKNARVTKVMTKKKPTVVCIALSGFNTEELKKRTAVLKKLNIPYACCSGHDWDESITHVIFGARGTRSLKFLAALASGAHVLNESYLDECEAQKCSKDSLPPIEDKHFFNGGRGLENKLICASASKFWYAWHASASKSTMNRGTDASSITEILKPFSNLDIVVPSFSSNANAKGEHQMVCDVLRVGGANVKTISPNGVASLAVYATATQENKMASDMDEDEEDTVDIIVCDKDKAASGRVKKAMDAYPDAFVVSPEYIKRFLSSPGEDLSAYALFDTAANEKVEDALIKRRLGGPHAVSLGAEKLKKRKFMHSSPTKTKASKKAKMTTAKSVNEKRAPPKPKVTRKKAATTAAAKKEKASTRAKRFSVDKQQTRGRRVTRALGTIN